MENKQKLLLTRDNSVLLIIDMQEKLMPVMFNPDLITRNTIKLLRFANIIKLPVLAIEQDKLGSTIPAIKNEILDFNPITKIDFNAAKCPAFLTALKSTGRSQIIIAGIESHICVTQTALQLVPDYTVHIISDAISSRTQENYMVAIERLNHSGATISSTEMVMFELLERAGTDEFKATLPLVK